MTDTLITGGTGYVGRWLYEYSPHKDRTYCMNRKRYQLHEVDRVDWQYVIHLAPVPVDDIIKMAKLFKPTILFASSGGVYDRHPDEYFQMKIDDEKKLLDSGLDVRIARIFTTCGAGMKWERYAIGNFIMGAERGNIDVQSGGLVVRSYMYGSDLGEWLWAILQHGKPGGIYNVGSDVPHSTQELAYEIASHYEPQPQINIIRSLQYEPRPFYVPDVTRARDELGLTIKVPFEEAVRRTVEDYKNEHNAD